MPFTSGPIPPCDTSYFTANVSGVGTLYPPGWGGGWTYSLQMLTINITSEHPWTLQISLTSPEGTTLLLSAFNGAGGQNYTNTTFQYFQYPSITTGTAPFTGDWTAEGVHLIFSIMRMRTVLGQLP
ncbi:MAG: proprotein convertase P-domain-containing protein [Flavobacteriales bacterium]|nr:proprotein convertase P-domain-containing protein [Flavobacteriales bacterium]